MIEVAGFRIVPRYDGRVVLECIDDPPPRARDLSLGDVGALKSALAAALAEAISLRAAVWRAKMEEAAST